MDATALLAGSRGSDQTEAGTVYTTQQNARDAAEGTRRVDRLLTGNPGIGPYRRHGIDGEWRASEYLGERGQS